MVEAENPVLGGQDRALSSLTKEFFFRASGLLEIQEKYSVLFKSLVLGALASEKVEEEGIFFGHEKWTEILSRPHDFNGELHPIYDITKNCYNAGLHKEIDLLLLSNIARMLVKEEVDRPVTMNVSVNSALDPDFWAQLLPQFGNIDPKNLIFELLEHPFASEDHPDIGHLIAMKERGYRFLLDDVTGSKDDDRRFNILGPIVDGLKVDGSLVRAHLDGEYEGVDTWALEALLKKISKIFPDKIVIAEFVYSAQEAKILKDIGFDGVQGRELKEIDSQLSHGLILHF